MVSIAGYIAGALLVVGIFITQRIRRTSKLARLDERGVPGEERRAEDRARLEGLLSAAASAAKA